jgi:hypothetical protein
MLRIEPGMQIHTHARVHDGSLLDDPQDHLRGCALRV